MEGVFVQQILVAETFIFFPFVREKIGQQPGVIGLQPIKETKETVQNHTLGPED